MITCIRRLEFDYGHRVYKHESKCRHTHGHRGVVEVTAQAPGLDDLGRIIDFSVLKEKIGGWIDENWDHNFIVFRNDTALVAALTHVEEGKKPFIADWNPTAENMGEYLLRVVCPKVLEGTRVQVTKVRLWETPNGSAECVL
jgi:6-pyruvoyltetrahydropterin/6-carboxytetrahydropterin synthase